MNQWIVRTIAAQRNPAKRLEVLLAMAGFTPPKITKTEGARRLGLSHQRMHQLLGRLWHHWDRAAPPAGVWQLQEWAEGLRRVKSR